MSATILVIDDDKDLRDTLTEALALEGYRTMLASNGREALDQLRAGPLPQLILLDLMMPVMNGWEFRDEQLRDPALAAIPTIVMTANAEAHSHPVDAARILWKPLRLDDLLSQISELLASR